MNAQDTADNFDAEGFSLTGKPDELRLQTWVSLAVAFGLAVAAAVALAPLLSGTV
jgi:hypothetical protein